MALVLNRPVEGRWRGKFVWSAERGGPFLEVRRFRNRFELSAVPREFIVHVSADSRYRLWINGKLVGRGPLKGTLEHYFYETYDLAPYLKSGTNQLAAEVQWFGLDSPNSEVHSGYAGFLFEGPPDTGLDTPGNWKVAKDDSLTPDRTPYIANAHLFLGFWEQLDVAKYPHGWLDAGFDDSAWAAPQFLIDADWPPNWGESAPLWDLHPREIPALAEEPRRFARTVRGTDTVEHLFGATPKGWTIPAGQSAELILDAGGLTTGFPEFQFKGGRGGKVTIVYAEAVGRWTKLKWGRWYEKGVRDDLKSGIVDGYRDTVLLNGGPFRYEPFHWRTFWFVRLVVEAGSEPVTIEDVSYRQTVYPQKLRASFSASDPDLEKLFALSWRTLELCSHETYEDCPYYEQLHYIYDARLEALQGYALCADRELPRRTIRIFRESLRSDGMIDCRVPSRRRQRIPYFALHWVMMVEDFWTWWGPEERAFVRENLITVDAILHWFRSRLRSDDFVGPLPYWNPVNGGGKGLDAAVKHGGSTYMTGLYVWALDAAVRLHEQAGVPADAPRWKELAERLRRAIRERAWSEKEGLFLEAPNASGEMAESNSQHTQMQAILSGAATPEQTTRLLKRLTGDPTLCQTVTSNTYDLCRALEKINAYGAFHDPVLKPWREMLAKHMSTLWETDSDGRSDCHAWASWIAYDFLTCILGVQPAKPGFAEIRIRPLTDGLTHAKGYLATPKGDVRVQWSREGSTLRFNAESPASVPVSVELPGKPPQRFEQGGKIELMGG